MPKEPRDKWDKLDVLLKPAGAILAAVTVAILSFIATGYFDRRQNEEMRTRLYTELISRREQAESVLRKDMFSKIIDKFLAADTAGMEEKVLNLELLTYNFHESLNLKPLFNHLIRKLPEEKVADSAAYLNRLRRVAREIKDKQIAVLGDHGAEHSIRIECPNGLINNPDSSSPIIHSEGFCLEVDSVLRHFVIDIEAADSVGREIEVTLKVRTPIGRRAVRTFADSVCGEGTGLIYTWNYLDLAAAQEVFDPPEVLEEPLDPSGEDTAEGDLESWEIEDDLAVKHKPDPADSVALEGGSFSVGGFDFPMIDNTRLGQMDHRLAVVLAKWQSHDDATTTIKITALCFPGSYASLKDRPFYDDIVDKLLPPEND